MNVTQNIWNTLTRLLVVLLGMVAVLGIVVWYEPVVQENQRMREEKFELWTRRSNRKAKPPNGWKPQLRSFENPTLEKNPGGAPLARERLSYAKPGENVIHFDPPASGVTPLNGHDFFFLVRQVGVDFRSVVVG